MLLIKIMSISRSSPSFIYLSAVNANILVKPNGSKQSWISEQCFLCYVCHFARYWADRWVLTCHSKLQKTPIKSMHEIMVSTNQRSVVPISQYLWFVTRGHGNDPGLEGESVRLEIICGVLSELEWMFNLNDSAYPCMVSAQVYLIKQLELHQSWIPNHAPPHHTVLCALEKKVATVQSCSAVFLH